MNHFRFQILDFRFILVTLVVGFTLSSCQKNEPTFYMQDLEGVWLQDNDASIGHYVHFTSEQSDEAGYLYGREWTTSDDKSEQDLLDQRKKDGFPGNGWFKYELLTDGQLTEIHLMKNGSAEIPKVYVVTKLNANTLEYHEKDRANNKFSFTKAE